MSKSVELLSNLLELPAIRAGRQRSGIATGLSLASGVAPVARLCQPLAGVEIIPALDGTITVRNNSTSDLAAGAQVIVSAIDEWFRPAFSSATVVTDGTDEDIPVNSWDGPAYAFGSTFASATVQAADTDVPIPFSNINGPLAKNGKLLVDGSDGSIGWILEGVYRIQFQINIALLAGAAATNVTLKYGFNGGAAQSNPLAEKQLDFSSGNTDHTFNVDFIALPTQSVIDAQDPNPYKVNFYINTNDAATTFRFSTSTSTAGSAGSIVVTRLGSREAFL